MNQTSHKDNISTYLLIHRMDTTLYNKPGIRLLHNNLYLWIINECKCMSLNINVQYHANDRLIDFALQFQGALATFNVISVNK